MEDRKKRSAICILVWVMIIVKCFGESLVSSALQLQETRENISTENCGIDVVMVVDNSESMWPMQDLRNDAMSTVLEKSVKGDDINIGCVYFADGDGVDNDGIYKDYSLLSIKTDEGYEQVSRELKLTLQYQSCRNRNIGKGLKKGRELFNNHDKNRKKVMILLVGGVNENPKEIEKQYADELTKQQVELLKSEEIILYCIYIKKDTGKGTLVSGEQTNEEYLKRTVNYFDENNHYDESRLFLVDENKTENEYVSELYDRLTEVFYSLRGIEYSKIYLDSENKHIFNVPKSGISKIQVYVKGKVKSSLKYVSTSSNGEFNNVESSNAEANNHVKFFTENNPVGGDWEISLSSENLRNVAASTVIIAYYKGGSFMDETTFKIICIICIVIAFFIIMFIVVSVIAIKKINEAIKDYKTYYAKLEDHIKKMKKIESPIPDGIKDDIKGYMDSRKRLYDFCDESEAPEWVRNIIIGESLAKVEGFKDISNETELLQQIDEINGVYSDIKGSCDDYIKQSESFTMKKRYLEEFWKIIKFKDCFSLRRKAKEIKGYVEELSEFVKKVEGFVEEMQIKENSISKVVESVESQTEGIKSVKEDLDESYKYWSDIEFHCFVSVTVEGDVYAAKSLKNKWFCLLDDMIESIKSGKSFMQNYGETKVLFEACEIDDQEDEENRKYGVCVVYNNGDEKRIFVNESAEIEIEKIGNIRIDVEE